MIKWRQTITTYCPIIIAIHHLWLVNPAIPYWQIAHFPIYSLIVAFGSISRPGKVTWSVCKPIRTGGEHLIMDGRLTTVYSDPRSKRCSVCCEHRNLSRTGIIVNWTVAVIGKLVWSKYCIWSLQWVHKTAVVDAFIYCACIYISQLENELASIKWDICRSPSVLWYLVIVVEWRFHIPMS